MPETRAEPNERRQCTIDAVATFTALMHAYEGGELATAAEAQGRLAWLGVDVQLGRPKARDEKGGRRA